MSLSMNYQMKLKRIADIKTYDYYISPSNGSQLTISISNIPKEYFEQLDFELDVNKYNL